MMRTEPKVIQNIVWANLADGALCSEIVIKVVVC